MTPIRDECFQRLTGVISANANGILFNQVIFVAVYAGFMGFPLEAIAERS
jgi:hypothetical protein